MDSINDVCDQAFEEMNKADKLGNIIEGVITAVLAPGISYVINKGVNKVCDPQNLAEKILIGVGSAGIGTALSFTAGQAVHYACHPFEQKKKQELLNKTLVLAQKQIMLSDSAIEAVEASQELSKASVDVSKSAHEEAELLLKAIYDTVDIPEAEVTMDDIVKKVDVSVSVDDANDVSVSVEDDNNE